MSNTKNVTDSSIEELVRKANKLGSDVIPDNYDETVQQMLTVMKSSGKILTVKIITEMFKSSDKTSKFWSDKMWNLAKQGILLHLSKRGHYQYNSKSEKSD